MPRPETFRARRLTEADRELSWRHIVQARILLATGVRGSLPRDHRIACGSQPNRDDPFEEPGLATSACSSEQSIAQSFLNANAVYLFRGGFALRLSRLPDLNRGPTAYEAVALPTELRRRTCVSYVTHASFSNVEKFIRISAHQWDSCVRPASRDRCRTRCLRCQRR